MLHDLLVCVVTAQPVAFIAAAHLADGGSLLDLWFGETTTVPLVDGETQVWTPVSGSGSGHLFANGWPTDVSNFHLELA